MRMCVIASCRIDCGGGAQSSSLRFRRRYRDVTATNCRARLRWLKPAKEKGGASAPLIQNVLAAYFSEASAPSLGAPVPDEPMNSLRPSGKVTSRPFALQIGVQALSFDW